MSMLTLVLCDENFGTAKVKASRRGRSVSRYSPTCSMSSPSRRSTKTNLPPTRASISTRTIRPVAVAKRNLAAISGSSQASKTRSGEASKRRTTRTVTEVASFIAMVLREGLNAPALLRLRLLGAEKSLRRLKRFLQEREPARVFYDGG